MMAFGALLVLLLDLDLFASLTMALATTSTTPTTCPAFDDIEHGVVQLIPLDYDASNLQRVLHVHCDIGYDLFGASTILCIDGAWKVDAYPRCVARCAPPPPLAHGDVEVDTPIGGDKTYAKGTVATYGCRDGYQLRPAEGKLRVCEKGTWTGTDVSCAATAARCRPPIRQIANGFFLHERIIVDQEEETIFVGHYYCNNGYKLKGEAALKCLPDGMWSPKVLPECILNDEMNCPLPDSYPHATIRIIVDNRVDDLLIAGTEVEFVCLPGYRNANNLCEPARMHCVDGRWKGMPPNCELAGDCHCPPNDARGTRFYYLETSGGEPFIFSLATGAAVLLILVVACVVIVCRKRKPLARGTVAMPPPLPSSMPRSSSAAADLTDHASLLHAPDRLALIAFADGMQIGQSGLPTYEEAIREQRGTLAGMQAAAARLQRPPWPSLASRRSRNSPNPDNMLFTRQGSFASHHTTSSRSERGDPMGSTDTMAVSENSTTVTLDTASSHSGSQPASCRAHCGSLASFDTSSVLNTEGVPLLEESELEEIQCGDTVSLAMENRSMCDSSSYKLSTASDLG